MNGLRLSLVAAVLLGPGAALAFHHHHHSSHHFFDGSSSSSHSSPDTCLRWVNVLPDAGLDVAAGIQSADAGDETDAGDLAEVDAGDDLDAGDALEADGGDVVEAEVTWLTKPPVTRVCVERRASLFGCSSTGSPFGGWLTLVAITVLALRSRP